MKTHLRDFLVGLTALAGLLGLAVMLLLFGELPFISQTRGYEVIFVLDDAAGLAPGSEVSLNGVRIGAITAARSPSNPRMGVELNAVIEPSVRVPRDAEVFIERDLLGESTLALRTSRETSDPSAGYMQPQERRVANAEDLLEQIAGIFDKRFVTIEDAARSISELSDTYVRIGEQLQAMLAPRTVAAVEAGAAAPNVASTMARLDQTLAAAQAWLGDEGLRSSSTEVVQRANAVLEQLSTAITAWQATAASVSAAADTTGAQLDKAALDFRTAAASLNAAAYELQTVLSRINEGEGTLGQLISNPDLYRSLNDAAVRLEQALLEARLLLEKYRKEGVPIQW